LLSILIYYTPASLLIFGSKATWPV
jgi:hypothetical protein